MFLILTNFPIMLNTIGVQLNYFRWDKKEEAHDDYFRFCRLLIKFREYVTLLLTASHSFII